MTDEDISTGSTPDVAEQTTSTSTDHGVSLRRRHLLKAVGAVGVGATGLGVLGATGPSRGDLAPLTDATPKEPPSEVDPYAAGLIDPVHYARTGEVQRKTNTQQVTGLGELVQKERYETRDAAGERSLLGHDIEQVTDPYEDLAAALAALETAAADADDAAMRSAAAEVRAILTGETEGRIYDGFSLLNYNRGGVIDGHVDGEYKMKRLRKSGETTTDTVDGAERPVWELDVNMFWHGGADGGKFDSDTFVIVAPAEMDAFRDPMRINYRIYSLIDEEFAPASMCRDSREGPVHLPFAGLDAAWTLVPKNSVTEIAVSHPPPQLLTVIYIWGWRAHPPRIQAMHPVAEIENAHTGERQLNGEGVSLATRWREIGVDEIGDAAPEKKAHTVATRVLDDEADATEVEAMLTDPEIGPRGTREEWLDVATDHRRLPPEAVDVLEAEGIDVPDPKLHDVEGNTIGPYRQVNVYMNNETWGAGPVTPEIDPVTGNSVVEAWEQGDQFEVKTINLDDHRRYFRVVDFGNQLNDALRLTQGTGGHAFQVFSLKPAYGVPKSAEVQWRTGWGFRPTMGVVQQWDVFSRPCDRTDLTPFRDETGRPRVGYLFAANNRRGATRAGTGDRPDAVGESDTADFRFDPPPPITNGDRLRGADGEPGVVIGARTEAFGVAKMCASDAAPADEPCPRDFSDVHPRGLTNVDTDGDGEPDALKFPPFLRNPDPEGGDVIPPTPLFAPFWFINPHNGSLLIDPDSPEKGYWVDRTYAHGRPVPAGDSISATFEGPREAGQVFYQFDPLFHDQSVFSLHPLSREEIRQEMKKDVADTTIREHEVAQHGHGDQLFTSWDEVSIDEGRKRRGLTDPIDASLSVEERHSGCDR